MEKIAPELLKELKESYESKDFLSANERNFLCSAIVDYFVSRKIKFRFDTMEELAQQIVEQFPKEDKVFSKNKEILKQHTFLNVFFFSISQKSWYNRNGSRTCGRFYFCHYHSRRNMAKQTSTNFTSRDNEDGKEKFVSYLINTRKN